MTICCQTLSWIVFCITLGKYDFIIDTNPMILQFACRLLLLSFHIHAWIKFANALDEWYNRSNFKSTLKNNLSYIGPLVLLITSCQFHIPFYSSRMLPNTFALIIVLHSYRYWISGNITYAATGLVTATTVFRCDILLLLGCVGLVWLLRRQLSLVTAIQIGILTGVACLLVIVPLDTMLWQREFPLWAEGEVLYYNAILGKSSNWGTSPWYWYVANAMPKMMLMTIVLLPLSCCRIVEYLMLWEQRIRISLQRGGRQQQLTATSSKASTATTTSWFQLLCPPSPTLHVWLDNMSYLQYLTPILGFIGLYSCLGHKEVRFIFPVMPIFNMGAAMGMSRLIHCCQQHDSSMESSKDKLQSWIIARFAYCCGLLSLLVTLIGSIIFVAVSMKNYPGGYALTKLVEHVVSLQHQQEQQQMATTTSQPVVVHVDVASAMSGVSLFGQRTATWCTTSSHSSNIEWIFDKAGYEEENRLLDEKEKERSLNRDGSSDDEDIVASGAAALSSRFSHILTEDPTKLAMSNHYHILHVIQGLPRLDIRHGRIMTEDAIYILERNDWSL